MGSCFLGGRKRGGEESEREREREGEKAERASEAVETSWRRGGTSKPSKPSKPTGNPPPTER